MFSLTRKKFILTSIISVCCLSTLLYTWNGDRRALELEQRRLHSMLRIEEQQMRRKDYIVQQCRHRSRDGDDDDDDDMEKLFQNSLNSFIVDDEHRLIYCTVPKVASTNWKRVLISLGKKYHYNPTSIRANESHAYHFKTLTEDTKKQAIFKLEHYFKFLFVRHPLERLLSAYRNKFENVYSDYFRLHFGRDIIKKYRSKPSEESLRLGHDVTFREFLTYIINLNASNFKRQFNDHWRPIYDMCMPCLVNYSVIGSYETLENDANYVLWKLKVLDKMEFPKRNLTYSSQPSTNLLFQYYSKIPKKLIERVLKVYEDDLTIFQYRPLFTK